MRITNLFVKDAHSVQEYAYCEDKNSSYRQEMEDSIYFINRFCSWRRYHEL